MHRSAALALILLAACVEQDDPATALDTAEVSTAGHQPDRWYHGLDNLVTVYAGSLAGEPEVTLANWQAISDAMDVYNANTAIHMVFGCPGATRSAVAHCTIPDDGVPHILFVQVNELSFGGAVTHGRQDLVGGGASDPMAGFVRLLRTASADGTRHEDFIVGLGKPTLAHPVDAFIPMHELGHVVGLEHEQRRNDAQNQLFIYDCCIDVAAQDAALGANEIDFTPYDYQSMMQYGSSTGSASCYAFTARHGAASMLAPTSMLIGAPPTNHASCAPRGGTTVTPQQQGFVMTRDSTLALADLMSPEDRNMLYNMYPANLGTTVAGDRFAAAITTGDFDGDGYKDIAIGAPTASPGGAVYIYKGTFLGVAPWKKLIPTDGVGFAQFGKALAAADLDGDGRAELIVGAPEGNEARGKVWVFHGDGKLGPIAPTTFDISKMGTGGTPQPNDHFGSVLAAGDFNKDGRAEIVIGVPARHRVFAIDETSPGFYAHYADFGAVQSDDFGAALAVGEVSGDAYPDLVIGAPHIGGNGRVMIARSQGGGGGFLSLVTVADPEPNADNWGAAVGVANLGAGGRVLIGEPMWNAGRGRVFVLDAGFGLAGQELVETQFNQPIEPGQFGATIAAGDTDTAGADHVIIGAPNARGGAGLVGIYKPNLVTHLLAPGNFFGRWLGDLANTKYGAALAIGNVDKRGGVEVIVGEPGFNGNAGEAYILHGIANAPLDYFDHDPSDATNFYDVAYAQSHPYKLDANVLYRH